VDIINKEHSVQNEVRKDSKETNIEEFFAPPKSPQKSDMNRHAKDSENNKTTLSGGSHLSAIEKWMK
jgi:hypothetical protein